MDRVYKSGAVAGAPAAADNASGPYPSGGNPAGGVPATKPGSFWYHMITESLAQCILGAGLVLDKTVLTRLKEAIIILGSQGAWPTGRVRESYDPVAAAGWVLLNDGTIGSATSGATTRANADTATLFTLLWNNISNSWCAVSGGRGASAAADFAANKTIALPKQLGRAVGGAGAGSGLTSRALGEFLGMETHTLSAAELVAHAHTQGTVVTGLTGAGASGFGGGASGAAATDANTGSAGSGNPFAIMQPVTHRNFEIKL